MIINIEDDIYILSENEIEDIESDLFSNYSEEEIEEYYMDLEI